MNLKEMIEEATNALGGKQAEVAKKLSQPRSVLTNAKAGLRGIPDDACVKLAEIIGIEWQTVIAARNEWTAKTEEEREFWHPLATMAKEWRRGSLKHLLEILERIEDNQAGFRSLTETIDTTNAAGRMMMQIIGAFAEFERELIRERTRAGIKAAKMRGVIFGRKYGIPLDDQPSMIKKWRTGKFTKSALAREYGVHISSIKRTIRRFDAQAQAEIELNAA